MVNMKLNKKYLPSSTVLFLIIGIIMTFIDIQFIQIMGLIISLGIIAFLIIHYAEKYDKWRKNT